MNKFKFELDIKGFGEILKGAEMMGALKQIANGVQMRAGDGYVVEEFHGFDRAKVVSVRAGTEQARQDNLDNNTLERALRR